MPAPADGTTVPSVKISGPIVSETFDARFNRPGETMVIGTVSAICSSARIVIRSGSSALVSGSSNDEGADHGRHASGFAQLQPAVTDRSRAAVKVGGITVEFQPPRSRL